MTASESLSADEILAQASALAEHLRRSGVQFLPQARPESVQKYRSQFDGSDAAAGDAAAAGVPNVVPSVVQEKNRSYDPPVPSPPPVASPSLPVAQSPSNSVPAASSSVPVASNFAPSAPVTLDGATSGHYPGEGLIDSERHLQLGAMAEEVAACMRCEALASCRTNTVFGEGSVRPRVVFFGEAPGDDEDRTGRPFVGKAGQLLTKMIEACSFRRDDVFILNTVKCRPPGNRNPEPEEIDRCRDFYQRQMSILRPEYIVCLGAISTQALLASKLSLGRLRGRFHRYFDSKVLVTYHPVYLLRNPAAKKAAWDDLQLMLRDAGIDPRAGK